MFFLCVSKVNGNASENKFFFCIFFYALLIFKALTRGKIHTIWHTWFFGPTERLFFFFFITFEKGVQAGGSPHKEHEL